MPIFYDPARRFGVPGLPPGLLSDYWDDPKVVQVAQKQPPMEEKHWAFFDRFYGPAKTLADEMGVPVELYSGWPPRKGGGTSPRATAAITMSLDMADQSDFSIRPRALLILGAIRSGSNASKAKQPLTISWRN